MPPQPIQVIIDDRARLMSAVLAASAWPDLEQARHRYRPHAHARHTARLLRDFAQHPAVQTLHALVDQGLALDQVFHYALTLDWDSLTPQVDHPWAPPDWPEALADFRHTTDIASWWDQEYDAWQRAAEQTAKVLPAADIRAFFAPFFGRITDDLTVMPNISYPGDRAVGVRLPGELVCLAAPRAAWGETDPWPFDEDPAHIHGSLIAAYGRLILAEHLRRNAVAVAPLAQTPLPVNDRFRAAHPAWNDQLSGLFTAGAVALFLEGSLGPREADAYILLERRLHGLMVLPAVVKVLDHYLEQADRGTYRELADYLPDFAGDLRSASDPSSR